MDKKIEMIKVSDIEPDIHQPRKNFDPSRLADLASSIRKHGIMNPLKLEKANGGKYIIVDGERRYRAAKMDRFTEVPAIVVESQDSTERLIEQFHLQEQHEGWSAAEKAVAVSQLAEKMKVTVMQMAETLSLPQATISEYVAFGKIIDKSVFTRGDIPITYARRIVQLRTFVKNKWLKHDKEFTLEMEESLEKAIVSRVKSGEIAKASELSKIRDAVSTDYTSITKFIKSDSMAVDRLFLDSNAKAASHERMGIYACNAVHFHLEKALALPGGLELLRGDARTKHALESALETIQKAIATV